MGEKASTSTFRYRHSGKFPPVGVVLSLAGGSAAGILLAFAYAYLVLYIPLAGYVTFILTAGFGGLTGGATGLLLHSQKVRNTAVAFAVGALVALLSFYTSWAVWMYAFLRRADADAHLLDIALQPSVLWKLVLLVNEQGAWNIHSTTPTGASLWFFWGLEAPIVLGIASVLPGATIAGAPFCEPCGVWCEAAEDAVSLAPGDVGELKQRLAAKDLACLEKLATAPPNAIERLRVDFHGCPKCEQTNTLSVKLVKTTIDKKGASASQATTDLVNLLLLDVQENYRMRRLAKRPAPSSSDTSPAPAAGTA